MGVIDLNARVTALEKNGAGGAEIDQIEADLTALEETVNGDGETDLGLVGDVEALETAFGNLVEDVTSKFTINPALTISTSDPLSMKIVRIGNVCFMSIQCGIASGASAAGSETKFGTLDSSIVPAVYSRTYCSNATNTPQQIYVKPNGDVLTTCGGYMSGCSIFWTISNT